MDENELMHKYLEDIKTVSGELEKKYHRQITIMEVCGGHTRTIMEYGIRGILPKNIRLVSGPGCPVCVSAQHDIDCMIELAHHGITIATYGDMLRVPGSRYTLNDARAKYGNVFEVYSAMEVLKLKERYPDIVFFGIGFETTAPMTAFLLKNGVCVYSVHKLVPPALQILATDDGQDGQDGEERSDGQKSLNIDGFIDPGHVSTIIGRKAYDSVKLPQVIAGFTPERILRAILLLLELIRDGKNIALNGYPEAVKEEGNTKAQRLLDDVFYVSDSEWRELGILPGSGLEVRDDYLNAKVKYKDIIDKVPAPKKTGCKCGDVIKGIMEPVQCPLYKKICTPQSPKGPCMVSPEGSCAISFQFAGDDIR